MKLPDFFDFAELNALRRKMGIASDVYGKMQVTLEGGCLTDEELAQLLSRDGLPVSSLKFVRTLKDGTLAYKNCRVFCFQRERNASLLPKFHIANCANMRTLRDCMQIKKFAIASRYDSMVHIERIDLGQKASMPVAHAVCEDCLEVLNFDGFRGAIGDAIRRQVVQGFDLERYFSAYWRTLPTVHDGDAARECLKWAGKQLRLLAAANWSCEKCQEQFIGRRQKYLQVHISHGSDQRDACRVLCVACHSDEPHHSSLKGSALNLDFLAAKIGTDERLLSAPIESHNNRAA